MMDDLLPAIWEAIGNDHISTAEVASRLEGILKYRCPDDLARALNKYRKGGLVKGEVSFKEGGWIWWADDECRSHI